MRTGIIAVGMHVPTDVVSNADIARSAKVDEQWIEDRTGIHERRYAKPGTRTSTLAHLAVLDLVESSPDALDDVTALVVATSTPDQPQPPTSAFLHRAIGLPSSTGIYDVDAVCLGFLWALITGVGVRELRNAPNQRVLAVAADQYSSIIDPVDGRTASLFGDGAGAALLGEVPDGYGLRSYATRSNPERAELTQVTGGGTAQPLDTEAIAAKADKFQMQGPKVAAYVREVLPDVVVEALALADVDVVEVGRFIFHQANPALVRQVATAMGLPPERVPITAQRYGNTAAASMPITLCESHRERPLQRGDHYVLAGVGGTLAAGAAVLTHY